MTDINSLNVDTKKALANFAKRAQTYANTGNNSGVVLYLIERNSITVQFGDGSIYVYTIGSVGEVALETMKELAREGQGLNSFINRNVRQDFAFFLKEAKK